MPTVGANTFYSGNSSPLNTSASTILHIILTYNDLNGTRHREYNAGLVYILYVF